MLPMLVMDKAKPMQADEFLIIQKWEGSSVENFERRSKARKKKADKKRMLNKNPVQRLHSILTKISMERLTRHNMVSVFVTGSF